MIKILFLVFFSIVSIVYSKAQENTFCALKLRTEREFDINELNVSSSKFDHETNDVLHIRIVFHVLYHSPSDSISVGLIEAILDEINLLWRAQNIDSTLIHPDHRSLLTDSKIQFCIAEMDPNGNTTNGINYQKSD